MIYLVLGFCGSGKSHLMDEMKYRGQIDRAIHDYYTTDFNKKHHENGESVFEASEYYYQLREWIRDGKNIAVADRMFVVEKELGKFINYLKGLDADIDIQLIAFTNEPEVAKANIVDRHKDDEDGALAIEYFHRYIDKYSPGYTPFKYNCLIYPTFNGELWDELVI